MFDLSPNQVVATAASGLNVAMPVLPLTTERLRLRVMRPEDAEIVTAYRNDEEVSRYQDWVLPYPLERAQTLLADRADLDDLKPGRWVSVAIEHEGALVGDVAVGLDDSGQVATIGYSLARAWHGFGFASEAVGSVVDAIFTELHVHRIVASVDPANHASMRVIEPLGFRREGLMRRSELIRGEWVDDLRFALLREERADWLARPSSVPAHVELVELSADNLNAVTALSTFHFQERFVAPVARSLAQALVPPMHEGNLVTPWYRAVAADADIVGFVMLSAANDWEPVPYLWRLLIDRRHQRRHIGEAVLHLLVEQARADGHRSLLVSFVEAPGGPRRFYERAGFVVTGPTDEGEIEARLDF